MDRLTITMRGMKPQTMVNVAQLDDFDEVIDVRSPAEYAEDHVPDAINCPVLDNEERARIGTMYVQVSPFAARKAGAVLVAKNIARHLETAFASREREWRPLVYCWRGGQRSDAMAQVLSQVGWRVARLEGGYKAYRHEVIAQLAELPARFSFRVISGATGSGKSRLLEALAAQGAQVLDLEALARHKGSVLGTLPGDPQPAQRGFESLVWDQLRRFDAARPVFVEAESKRIGQLQVPEALIEAMRAAPCVRIEAPLEERVAFLIRDYDYFLHDPHALKEKLDRLVELHGKTVIARWKEAVDRGDWPTLVADLLQNHYDPAYRKSTLHNYARLAQAATLRPRDLSQQGIADAAAELLRSETGASGKI